MGGGAVGKTYTPLAGHPLIVHTLRGLLASPRVDRVFLVVAPGDVDACAADVVTPYGLAEAVTVVAGGSSRQESVFRGLLACRDSARFVVIHDGARPLVTSAMVRMTLDAARQVGAATVAVPVTDTLKRGDGEHRVAGSVDREWLWSIQTPQAFRLDLLLDAHLRARSEGISATDDASLIERVGRPVQLVLGDARNIKVTTPDDLPMAEYLLSRDRESATS
jgi:2-C-methyl-D-erythritol 4-phosphate cytidylyltransferase